MAAAAAAAAKKSENGDSHGPPEGSAAWYFHEFWPVMVFGSFFTLMFALPLVFSGTLSLYGLLIALCLLGGVAVLVSRPKWMATYLLLWGAILLIINPGSIHVGFWPILMFFASALFFIANLLKKR